MSKHISLKKQFKTLLQSFASTLGGFVSTKDQQWTIKGFIDVFQNIYTISADTKIVSKILEIHLFPKLLEFAQSNGYKIVLAEIGIMEFVNQFMYDFRSAHVGMPLMRLLGANMFQYVLGKAIISE